MAGPSIFPQNVVVVGDVSILHSPLPHLGRILSLKRDGMAGPGDTLVGGSDVFLLPSGALEVHIRPLPSKFTFKMPPPKIKVA